MVQARAAASVPPLYGTAAEGRNAVRLYPSGGPALRFCARSRCLPGQHKQLQKRAGRGEAQCVRSVSGGCRLRKADRHAAQWRNLRCDYAPPHMTTCALRPAAAAQARCARNAREIRVLTSAGRTTLSIARAHNVCAAHSCAASRALCDAGVRLPPATRGAERAEPQLSGGRQAQKRRLFGGGARAFLCVSSPRRARPLHIVECRVPGTSRGLATE